MIILAGSLALKKALGDKFWRPTKDQDFIVSPFFYEEWCKTHQEQIITTTKTRWGVTVHKVGSAPIEFEIVEPGSLIEEFVNLKRERGNSMHFLSPDEVYTFKMSHRFKKNSSHFKKTMDDIINLRKLGYEAIPDIYQDWYKRRSKATYNYSHPDLTQQKDSFFNKGTGIEYIYDHDSIHRAVALNDVPAYTLYHADGETVKTSKEKFFSLDQKTRLLGVLEESYVLALERHQIPNDFKPDRKKSFDIALMKVCTSITSGWFREFAWEHYYDVQNMYNDDYVNKFLTNKEKGLILPYEGE